MSYLSIDGLEIGKNVCLSSAGTLWRAEFIGITGSGTERRATFKSWRADGIEYVWDAYRYQGRWVCGSSADRLSVIADDVRVTNEYSNETLTLSDGYDVSDGVRYDAYRGNDEIVGCIRRDRPLDQSPARYVAFNEYGDEIGSSRTLTGAAAILNMSDDETVCEKHGIVKITDGHNVSGFTGATIYILDLACGCQNIDDSGDTLENVR